jgi:four helix bundle protein
MKSLQESLTSRTGQDRTYNIFDIPIFQKLYDFYQLLYQYIKLFPKQDRYSLGVKLEHTALEILEYIFFASNLRDKEKVEALQKADVQLDLLKVFIRLAKDVKALDIKKYLELEKQLQEIGKMLGGWLKSAKQNTL